MDEPRVLLVEEDRATRAMLEARLRKAGLRVTGVADAAAALALLRAEPFAAMISDGLTDMVSGGALIAAARSIDPELELVILTGAASIESAIAAVNYGVHAYLRKPARQGELEERVHAALEQRQMRLERQAALRQLGAQLLRIAEPAGAVYEVTPAPWRLSLGRLELDPQQRRAAVDRRVVPLSRGEFDLLLYMARRDRQVLSSEQLAREALGIPCCTTSEARELVKVRIHRLRQKIESDPQAPALLVSVRGAGYMLVASA